MNPIRQEKKRFCLEHGITGKRYKKLLKRQKRAFKAAMEKI
jgi:hypothetical protein